MWSTVGDPSDSWGPVGLRAGRGFYGMTPRLLSRRAVRATETTEYPVMSGLVKANGAVSSARARVRRECRAERRAAAGRSIHGLAGLVGRLCAFGGPGGLDRSHRLGRWPGHHRPRREHLVRGRAAGR